MIVIEQAPDHETLMFGEQTLQLFAAHAWVQCHPLATEAHTEIRSCGPSRCEIGRHVVDEPDGRQRGQRHGLRQ